MIRLTRSDELPALREVERAAGALFRVVGMDAIADHEPPSVEELALFQQDGRAWVATDDTDQPVGYLLVDVVDGAAHVEQVSVHPSHARQGLGRTLLETAVLWAQQQALDAVTLTTFSDVPWNAPYYQRLGFRTLAEAEVSEGLRRIREQEAARGLDAWPRVSMRRPVASPGDTH
jgi:ribosomal protein S18 acetylase RimI-like enzyme